MGIKDYIATCTDDGAVKEEYRKAATDTNLEELIALNAPAADAVVLACSAEGELTALMIGIAARYLGFGRSRQPSKERPDQQQPPEGGGRRRSSIRRGLQLGLAEESLGRAAGVPLVVCCSDKGRRRVTALACSAMVQALNASFDVEGIGADARSSSDLFLDALRCSEAEGGFDVEFADAVLATSNLDVDVEFANRAGIRSLLATRSMSLGLELAAEVRRERLPCWTLPSLADL